jgi:hypothetical protein
MSNFVLDLDTAQKLRDAGQCLELRDPKGVVVGYFRPAVAPEDYRKYDKPFTKEELDRFANEPGGRSLDEIMRDLRGRA